MKKPAIDTPSRILFVMPTWVGDAVLATPLIEAVHEHRPEARKDVLIKPYLRGLLDDAPWRGRLLEWPGKGGFGGLRSVVAEERYDWGILLPNSFRPAFLLWAARVRRRVGYARNGRGPLLTDRLPFPSSSKRPFRMVDFYGALGDTLGVSNTRRPMRLYVRDEIREKADRLLHERGFDGARPLIGVNPGAKYGSSKLWPARHFAETADAVCKDSGGSVVILAGPGEDTLAGEIMSLMRCDAITLPSSAVDLEMLKGVVSRLDLLISNDTGPRHIAAAFGVPSVTVFGPTHTTWGDSGFERSVDIAIKVDCGPCMERTCPLGHHRCMVDLEPDRVIAAGRSLLDL